MIRKRLLSFTFIAMIVMVATVPSFAQQKDDTVNKIEIKNYSQKTELEENLDILERYTATSDEGYVSFDVEAAIAAGEEDEIVSAGQILNQYSTAMRNDTEEATVRANKISIPIWGNWCGPGHGGGASLDLLDEQCRKHDLCYADRGYLACTCDNELLANIKRNYDDMRSNERKMATVVTAYFSHAPCDPRH